MGKSKPFIDKSKPATVYRLVHNGDLPAVRVGRSFRVREEDANEYIRIAQLTSERPPDWDPAPFVYDHEETDELLEIFSVSEVRCTTKHQIFKQTPSLRAHGTTLETP